MSFEPLVIPSEQRNQPEGWRTNSRELGVRGEELAVKRLRDWGWRILGRNWHDFMRSRPDRRSMVYIPEDRKGLATCPSMDLLDNFLLTNRNGFQNFGFLDRRHSATAAEDVMEEDQVVADGLDATAGSLSGAPKIRACQLIGELEDNKRGIYGGAIGYIDFTGNMDTCIAIRIAYKKNGKVFVRSGAGIVADSVPEKEYEECINKARAVVNALKCAEEADL